MGTLTYTVRGISLPISSPPTFARFLIQYAHLWSRERFLTGLIIEVAFHLLNAPVSVLILFAESRLYQWLRRNTVDRLTFKHPDVFDANPEAAWQERQDVETILTNYLDDMPSMPFSEYWIAVSAHTPQRTSRLSMDPREVARQECCPTYFRTRSGTINAFLLSQPWW